MENIFRDLLSTDEPSEIEPNPPVDKFMELRRIIIEQRAKIEKLESDLKQFCSDKKSLESQTHTLDSDIVDLQCLVSENQDECSRLKDIITEKDTEILLLKENNIRLESLVKSIGEPDDKDRLIEGLVQKLNIYKNALKAFREKP